MLQLKRGLYLVSFIYWSMANLKLYDITHNTGIMRHSQLLDNLLAPGYMSGFVVAFGGGGYFVLLVQFFVLIIATIAIYSVCGLTNKIIQAFT